MADKTPLEEATQSLSRVQTFDLKKLPRKNDLGKSFNFENAVPHAERLINMFQKVPLESLSEFPLEQTNQIKAQSDAVYNIFVQIENFDDTLQNATQTRNTIISQLESHYQGAFNQIMPIISYGVARTVDFSRLETDGRAALQTITDKTDEILEEIEESKTEAASVLEEIKRTAAEQGVSQQASYFAEESKLHDKLADDWKLITIYWSIGIIVFGFASFFLHKIPWIAPEGVAESIIFVSSKFLIFAILSYMLILSARNFMSHKHNAVINKHRQNALMTFNALVKATGGKETQDIVLSHASSCIFSPQDTGYNKHGGSNSSQMPNVVEMLPKTIVKMDGS